MGRGPANPSTLGEGWENLEPSQSRAQPLQEVCSRVPRTLQLSQTAEGLVGGKEPVLGRIPQAGLKRGQGRPWESIKHLTQMGVPRGLSESSLSVPVKMVISLLLVAVAALFHSSVVLTGPHAPLPRVSASAAFGCPAHFFCFLDARRCGSFRISDGPPVHCSPHKANSADLLGDQFLLQDPHRTPYSDSTVMLLFHMLHALFQWHFYPTSDIRMAQPRT